MSTAIVWILSIIGNILIMIAMLSTYIWCLPLGIMIELVAGYFYIKNKRKLRRDAEEAIN